MSQGRNKETSLLQYCRREMVVVRTRVAKEKWGVVGLRMCFVELLISGCEMQERGQLRMTAQTVG